MEDAMTTPFPNVPGAGAMNDSLEFVKNLWGSMGVPGMSMPSLAAPAMSIDDLDKKIADLKAVESWLNVNGAMLRATIQGLEVQRGTLATLKSMGASFADAMKQAAPDAAKSGAGAGAGAAPMMPDPTVWWNMLQEQFKQAVASAVPPAGFGAPAEAGGSNGAQAAPAEAPAPARGARARPAKS
jgi:hypothetical protein